MKAAKVSAQEQDQKDTAKYLDAQEKAQKAQAAAEKKGKAKG